MLSDIPMFMHRLADLHAAVKDLLSQGAITIVLKVERL